MATPPPCPDEDTILAFLAGRLTGSALAGVDEHLQQCEACRELVAALAPMVVAGHTVRADAVAPANPPSRSLARGANVGRYVILDLVGRGAMGAVYAAYDPELDRRVALKLLHEEAAGQADSAQARARLLREAQAIARLSHPNVIVVHDAGAIGDQVFLAMEFVEGETLGAWLAGKPHSWEEVKHVFLAAGRGLQAAHAAGLVHRDFKPHNVMVTRDGDARVMDFGLAREPDRDAQPDAQASAPTGELRARGARAAHLVLTQTGTLIGTPAYMAPEQFRARRADARSDQFGFCVVLYEALYGERPFDSTSLAVLADAVVNGRVRAAPVRSRVPAWLRKVLLRGLDAEPARRFGSMADLLAALDRDPLRRRRRVLLGAGLAILLLAGGMAAGKLASRTGRSICAGAATRLSGIWEAAADGSGGPRRNATRAAFLATGRADAAALWARAAAVLDAYAARWTAMYGDACEATHVRGEQSAAVLDLRMDCLRNALQSLQALTGVLVTADARVMSQAVGAAESLPDIGHCADVSALRAVIPPPADPEVRRKVEAIHRRAVEARALGEAGRDRQAYAQAQELVVEARPLGYAPLMAETFAVQGALSESDGRVDNAYALYLEALWAAEESHDDVVAAEAAVQLAGFAGWYRNDEHEGRIWAQLGEAKLKRLDRPDERLRGWLVHNEGLISLKGGQYARARDEFQQAVAIKRARSGESVDMAMSMSDLARALAGLGLIKDALATQEEVVAIVERSAGKESWHTGLALDNRGEYLTQLGRREEALDSYKGAIASLEASVGPEHAFVADPLTGMGADLIALGRPREALPLLRRALELQRNAPDAGDRAETRFALARATWEAGGDPNGARALAQTARAEFAGPPARPAQQREIDAWLLAHPVKASRSRSPSPAPRR